MPKKVLLTSLTTVRDGKRVKFAAKSTVNLTKDELDLLDRLEKSTGRTQYRNPVNESATEDDPQTVVTDLYDGEKVAMDDKTAEQLKAYLTHSNVTFAGNASKTDLLKAAKAHEADGGL